MATASTCSGISLPTLDNVDIDASLSNPSPSSITVEDLGVEIRFEALMQKSVGANSVYMEMINKIDQIELDSQSNGNSFLKPSEKAQLIAQLSAQIVPAITTQAMTTALQWAKEDRDAQYDYLVKEGQAKVSQATFNRTTSEIANTMADTTLKSINAMKVPIEACATKDQAKAALINADANAKKTDASVVQDYASAALNFGRATTEYGYNGTISTTTFTNTGYSAANSPATQRALWEAQENQAIASTYMTYARSYREYGAMTATPVGGVSYTGADAAIDNGVKNEAAGLVAMQTLVQSRQETAFDDNVMTHILNSASNMTGIVLAEQTTGSAITETLDNWNGYICSAMAVAGITNGTVSCPTIVNVPEVS